MSELLRVDHISKSFERPEGGKFCLWHSVNFALKTGESAAICGESGSGKSTLLLALGGVESIDAGHIYFQDKPVTTACPKGISYVLQNYHLIEELSVLDNILMPLYVQRGTVGCKDRMFAASLMERLKVDKFANTLPKTLSGGERQRVAIARSMMTYPKLILADEPTGSLDEKTGLQVMDLFFWICKEYATSFILVTHNKLFAKKADKRYFLEQGTWKSEL